MSFGLDLSTVGGGKLEFVETLDLATAGSPPDKEFTDVPAGYMHRFIFEDVVNATGGNNLFFRCSTNGGTSYDSTASYVHALSILQTGGTQDNRTGSQTGIQICGTANNGTTAGNGATGWIDVMMTNSSGSEVTFIFNMFPHSSARSIVGSAYYNSTTAVDALQLIPEGGNLGAAGKLHHMRLKLS